MGSEKLNWSNVPVVEFRVVASEANSASTILNGVVNMVKSEPDMILVDYTTEML